MANDSGGIRAGAAFVELFVKGNISGELSKVEKDLRKVGTAVADIGKKMAAFGTVILGSLGLASEQFASMGDQITKASQRTGIAAETLQGLKYAAEQSGASFEDLETGIKKMQKAVVEASKGNDGAIKSFAELGISVDDLKSLSPDEQFLKLSEALNQVQDEALRTAISMELFGKGGTSLLPLISEGSEGIKKLADRARELGLIFSKEDALAATKFGDTVSDLGKQVKITIFHIGAAVANALQPFADGAIKCMTTVINWAKENRPLVTSLLIAGAAITAVGAGLITLGVSLKFVAFAMSGIKAGFSLLIGVLNLVTNPIVLIGVALAALVGYFLLATETGGKVVSFLKGKFASLYETCKEVFGGIADALAAGDISLAAKILWVGIKSAFLDGTIELQKAWEDFKSGFVQTAIAAFYGTLEIYETVKAALLTAFDSTVEVMGNIWDTFTSSFSDAWDVVTTAVAKGINYLRQLFDDSFDASAANKMADQQLEANKKERQENLAASKQARSDEAASDIAKVDKDKQKAIEELTRAELAYNKAASDNANKQKGELDKELGGYKEQLAALRKTAAEKAAAIKKNADDKGVDPNKRFGELSEIGKDIKSHGIFNAAAIQSLQSFQSKEEITLQKRIAKAAEETAKNTKNKATFK